MKRTPSQPLARLASLSLATALLAAAPAALGQYYSSGHGDIGIELHGDHFHTHWHLGSTAIVDGVEVGGTGEEFHPDEIIAWTTTRIAAPSGASLWLGVADGTQVFAAGSTSYQPNLGFAAESIGLPADWSASGGGLTLTLSSWSNANPGQFALLHVGRDHTDILMSTFAPAQTEENNSLFLRAGSHSHYDFLFTEAGYYELTFTWTGTHNTYGEITWSDTYGFHAGAIPEPSTWALLLGSVTGVGVIALRRRKRT